MSSTVKRGRGRPRRVNGSGAAPNHSVRVSDEIWAKAARRAEYENTTVSAVAAQIIEGYALGLLDLPRVQVTYMPTRQPAVETTGEAAGEG